MEKMDPYNYMMDVIHRFYDNDRLFNYESMLRTCAEAEILMGKLGMTEVKTLHFPSDGKIDHGGWLMPLAWHAREGILSIVHPDGREERVCSYGETPCSLMLYSRGADVKAEMAVAGIDEDVNGKIVLVTDRFLSSFHEADEYFRRGALGVLGSWLPSDVLGKPGYDYLMDSCQWLNYSLPFWAEEKREFGFSLTPNQRKRLLKLRSENGSVTLHAKVDAETEAGTIPLVTGLLPGRTNEEILITGHLFEEGADDNASGGAMALAIVKGFVEAGKVPKRGIRLMFTHEIKSLQAYLNSNPSLPHFVAGLDLDMVGVSLDGKINIGDSAPIFPTYAPALLDHFATQYGFRCILNAFHAMDTQFTDNEYKVPMSYMDLFSVPDYHKSGDTPETISRAVLETNYKIAGSYVEFLADASFEEAKRLSDITYDFSERRISGLKANGEFPGGVPTPEAAGAMARARQESILPLIESSQRIAFRKYLEPVNRKIESLCDFPDSVRRPELNEKQKEKLKSLVFRKNFHGFLSFEKYMMRKEEFPEYASFFNGWCVPSWIEYALMWGDGERSALDIWNLLIEYGYMVDADRLYLLLQFLWKEGYLHMVENLTGKKA